MRYICTYIRYDSAIKIKEMFYLTLTTVNLNDTILSEISQA